MKIVCLVMAYSVVQYCRYNIIIDEHNELFYFAVDICLFSRDISKKSKKYTVNAWNILAEWSLKIFKYLELHPGVEHSLAVDRAQQS